MSAEAVAIAPEPEPQRCTNCGVAGADVYCPKCGEKQPDHHDLAAGHFAHETVHELLHLDSKLFATLAALVLKPGQLTAEYFAGRKKRYIAPLRLFLTLFALQLVAYTAYKPAAVYTLDAFAAIDDSGRFAASLERGAAKHGLSVEVFKERVDYKWHKAITWLQLGNILGVALVLQLLYRRRYLAEHLVFASHLLSFTYLATIALWPVYLVIGVRRSPAQSALSVLFAALALTYNYLALRRFFGSGKRAAMLKTAVLYAGSIVVTLGFTMAGLVYALVTVH
jgi:hypothetical protein